MNSIGQAIAAHITANLATILTAGGILFVAFVSCMPIDPPSSLVEYWRWVRESLQTAIPAARRNHIEPPNPSQPVIPAQPPK